MSGGAKIYVGNLSWNTNDELLGQVSVEVVALGKLVLTLRFPSGFLPIRSGHRRSCRLFAGCIYPFSRALRLIVSLSFLARSRFVYICGSQLPISHSIHEIHRLAPGSRLVLVVSALALVFALVSGPALVSVVVCGFLASFPCF